MAKPREPTQPSMPFNPRRDFADDRIHKFGKSRAFFLPVYPSLPLSGKMEGEAAWLAGSGLYVWSEGSWSWPAPLKRWIVLEAVTGAGTVSSGATGPTKVALSISRNYWHLGFPDGITSIAFWDTVIPYDWDRNLTIVARLHWYHDVAGATGDVLWGVAGALDADGELLSAPALSFASLASPAAGQQQLRIHTIPFTLRGNATPGATMTIGVMRSGADASDTLAAEARLIKVVLEYGV